MGRYREYPFQGFGKGLNLQAKPDAVDPAECIDALNVIFSERGAIRPRSGYAALMEAELTNRVDSLSPFYTAGGGTRQLIAGCGTRLEALGTTGTIVASATGLSTGPWGFARFGDPNAEVLYAGNGKDTLRRWNGSAFSAPTATVDEEAGKAMPKGGALAVWDLAGNRLAVSGFQTTSGGPAGGISSPHHVYFCEPGDPTAWSTLAYSQLSPGDGERIMNIIAWRELLFVFKETKFFVFYGANTDTEANPEFNFRPIEVGAGLVAPQAVCADPTGVYFMGRHGIYRTTGQDPELISGAVAPIWEGGQSLFYRGGTLAHGSIEDCAMTSFANRIYLSFPTSEANDRTLVYDTERGWWSLFDLPCSAMTTFRAGTKEELAFGYSAGEKLIGLHGDTYTNDAGAAISERWRSGWFDLGSPAVKKVRAQKIWGSGTVAMGLSGDFEQGVGGRAGLSSLDFSDPTTTDWDEATWSGGTWAEPKALRLAHRRKAERGTTFSLFFQNETKDQAFSIHRVELLIPKVREPAKGRAHE